MEAKAKRVPAALFTKSAERALIHSYEDFCRVKNAYVNGDEVVLRDNVLGVTHSAALVVASLNRAHFVSDRGIFKAHRRFRKLPRGYRRIEQLRYGKLRGRQLFETLTGFYCDLVAFAAEEGVHFPREPRSFEGASPLAWNNRSLFIGRLVTAAPSFRICEEERGLNVLKRKDALLDYDRILTIEPSAPLESYSPPKITPSPQV